VCSDLLYHARHLVAKSIFGLTLADSKSPKYLRDKWPTMNVKRTPTGNHYSRAISWRLLVSFVAPFSSQNCVRSHFSSVKNDQTLQCTNTSYAINVVEKQHKLILKTFQVRNKCVKGNHRSKSENHGTLSSPIARGSDWTNWNNPCPKHKCFCSWISFALNVTGS
jgi:hypothetical protein